MNKYTIQYINKKRQFKTMDIHGSDIFEALQEFKDGFLDWIEIVGVFKTN